MDFKAIIKAEQRAERVLKTFMDEVGAEKQEQPPARPAVKGKDQERRQQE